MRIVLFSLLSLGVALGAFAQPVDDPSTTLQTNARFASMIDFETGAVLFSKDGDQQMAPASMAKLMTVAIVFEKLKHGDLRLEDTFTVSEKAWRLSVADKKESSKMFVSIGSQIKVEDLLRGIIIQSGNDACAVVAEHFSGSEEAFADLMNAEAKKIGLADSVFKNASGLPDPAMHTTAHDLARLGAYIVREFPDYYHYFGEREFTWNGIKQQNRNMLLGVYPGADGLKTGHTADSGYGMVSSAQQDGRRLILVVNGLANEIERANESKRLLDLGFREFKTFALLKPGDVVGEAGVWAGAEETVPLTVKQPVKLLMRRASRAGMKATLSYMEPVLSPVTKGQEVGKLTITAPGLPDVVVPVVAGADVEDGGLFTRIKIGVRGMIAGRPDSNATTAELKLPGDGEPAAPAAQ